MKKKPEKKDGRQYWGQVVYVKGVSKACLERIKELVEIECAAGGGVVAFDAPTPSCGGSGDPC
jgi:hypothetical protein